MPQVSRCWWALSLLGAALLLSAIVIVFRATGTATTDGAAA
jgi:hypothetical protein